MNCVEDPLMLLDETPESPAVSTVLRNTRLTLEMIKIEHTLFALPFAFLGAVLAANGLPTLRQLLWIVVAMVGARSTAMAFNRLADRRFDARNPRTAMRALPAELLSVNFVWTFTIASAMLFLLAAAMLNRLTLILAPVALASVLLYSSPSAGRSFAYRPRVVSFDCTTGAWIACVESLEVCPTLAFAGGLVMDRRFRCTLRMPGLRL
jgi:4-hydroxybenzoate polyprenyltransferase